jgi:hypothetical protein
VRHGGGDHHAAHRQVRRPAQYTMHRQPVTDAAQQTAAQRVDAPELAVAARTHTRARIRAHAPAGGAHRRARTAVVGAEERTPPARQPAQIDRSAAGRERAGFPAACLPRAGAKATRRRRGGSRSRQRPRTPRRYRVCRPVGPSHS